MEKYRSRCPCPPLPPILSHICLPNSTSLIDWVFRVLSHAVYYSSAAGRPDWIHRQNSHLKFLRHQRLFYKQVGCSSDPSAPEGALVCVWEHSLDMKTQTCHKLCTTTLLSICVLEKTKIIWSYNPCFIEVFSLDVWSSFGFKNKWALKWIHLTLNPDSMCSWPFKICGVRCKGTLGISLREIATCSHTKALSCSRPALFSRLQDPSRAVQLIVNNY